MFKFHSPHPTGDLCAIHETPMEAILAEPSPMTVRLSDGTSETHEVRRVVGWRHEIEDGTCTYGWHPSGYAITRTAGLYTATWQLVDGQPTWEITNGLCETLVTVAGPFNTLSPTTDGETLTRYVSLVLEKVPEFTVPPMLETDPYHEALDNLRKALVARGAGVMPLDGLDVAFELNSVVSALALPLFDVNHCYGQTNGYLQAVADQNGEDLSATIARSVAIGRGEPADWMENIPEVVERSFVVRPYGENILLVPEKVVLSHLLPHSGIPEAIRFSLAQSELMCALMQHGHYDPSNGHQPPVGRELDAAEIKAHSNEIWDNAFPGFSGLFRDRVEAEDDED